MQDVLFTDFDRFPGSSPMFISVTSNVNNQNACFFQFDEDVNGSCSLHVEDCSHLFLCLEWTSGSSLEVSGANLLLLWGKTLLLRTSCQKTSFPDVLLASLWKFPCIRRCISFFSGIQW